LVRQTARIIFVEALGAIVILLVVAGLALAMRLSAGPMSLGFAKSDIEQAISKARDGRDVALEDISLQWLSSERRVIVVATNFEVFDDAGEPAAKAERVEILLNVGALLRGRIEPIGLVLEQGWILARLGDGRWTLAGDPIGSASAINPPQDLSQTDWFSLAEATLTDVLATLREDSDGLALQMIAFSDFELVAEREDKTEIIRLSEAYGRLRRGADGIEIEAGGINTAPEEAPGRLTIALSAPSDYSVIASEIGFLDWSFDSILDLVPAYDGALVGFPGDASLAFRVSEAHGLEDLQFGLASGAGRVEGIGAPFDVSSISLGGDYTLADDRLTLEIGALESTWVSGPMNLALEDALHGDGARGFKFESNGLVVDLTSFFDKEWPLQTIRAEGMVSFGERKLELDQFAFRYAGDEHMADFTAAGQIAATPERVDGELPVEAKITAAMTGVLPVQDLMRFWPTRQGKGARSFVNRNVELGTVTEAMLTMDLLRDSAAAGHLADEALEATFKGEGVRVKALPDIPVVSGATVDGRITGNSVKINFANGALSEWQLRQGSVHYPQLAPAGEDMILMVEGAGPATDLVQIISDSRLQLQERSGFNPGNVSGEADLVFELRRPAIPDAPISSIRYKGEGQLRDGGLANVFADLSVSGSAAQIEFDETGLRVFGDGLLESSSISYDWSFPFGEDAPRAELTASTVLTPDLLNHLGVSGRAYVTGSVPMDIVSTLRGAAVQTASIDLDFQEARLDVAEVGWVKPAGNAALGNVVYERSEEDALSARVTFRAPDASLDAAISLAEDGKLIGADIDKAKLANRFDLGGTALRTETGGLQFDVAGDLLDLSQLIPSFTEIRSRSGPATADFGEIGLKAEISKLVLGRDIDLSDAQFALRATEDGLQTIDVRGRLESGSPFSAAYDASGLGDPAFLVTSGDAGFLPNLLFGRELIRGGELQMTGTIGQDDLPTQVRVVITDGRLIEAPVITQILSIASLRGLSDTLTGDGILFSNIEVPLSIKDGRYSIVGARASGPALGMTAKGWMNPADGDLDIDGVLVPSFGVNSALGGLPLIGDLFVSREGEGVFSLRYGVEGTLERAQVSVNPLSAITPGVLRRIFEEPETAELPPLEQVDPIPAE
jgi:hypothetical protein